MKEHFKIIKENFIRAIKWYLGYMLYDEKNINYTPSHDWENITEASAYAASTFFPIIAYYLDGSGYYHDTKMIELARSSLREYMKCVHEDGSVDFPATNFHDPAQTAFNVFEIFSNVELVEKLSTGTKEEAALLSEMRGYLRMAGNAMVNLGFHTPNHRWAICASLAIVYNQLHDEKYLETMNRYLAEGVDCDENGEYTERSSGHYNNTCNIAFLELYHQFGDASFLEYPRRNLYLMRSFVEPDGTINSLNSTRWDSKLTKNYDEYYAIYYTMALLTKNEEFAYIADSFLSEYKDVPHFIIDRHLIRWVLLDPSLLEVERTLQTKKPTAPRSVYLPNSHIARMYNDREDMTVTVYRGYKPNCVKIQHRDHIIYVRFAGAFFGDPHSQFRPTVLEQIEDGYRLYGEQHQGYRSLFDTPPETSVWREMDQSKRRWINIQDFKVEMLIKFKGDEVTLTVNADGCEGIPTKFELSVEPGCKFDSNGITTFTRAGDYFFPKGNVKFEYQDHTAFEISGCYADHYYAKDMRGAVPPDESRATIAMTSFTPHGNTITVKATRKN